MPKLYMKWDRNRGLGKRKIRHTWLCTSMSVILLKSASKRCAELVRYSSSDNKPTPSLGSGKCEGNVESSSSIMPAREDAASTKACEAPEMLWRVLLY